MTTPADLVTLAANEGVEFIDVRFTDVPGQQQHMTFPVSQFSESVFANGLGFDGSSIQGFQPIDDSDMLLIPDTENAFIDPFYKYKTLVLSASVRDPVTQEEYDKDPSVVARRAEQHLLNTGIAETCFIGPELEFFLFDSVVYGNTHSSAHFEIASVEAPWASLESTDIQGALNTGHKIPYKGGYVPLAPRDSGQDLRSQMTKVLEECGVEIELHHHEVGTGGQSEIDLRFDSLKRMADKAQIYKYVCKNVAAKAGKTVTFMPKPVYQDNGSGMHTHISLWNGDDPLFYGDGYAGLSQMALHFIGGLLKHAPAVLAFCAPTINSYKRLVPGYEAPVNLAYSQRNRSAAIRIPMYSMTPVAKRIEFRCPDPSANPYLAFAAMLMAGLDGIENEIHPGDPLDVNLYDLSPKELEGIDVVPGALWESLDALEADHEFLQRGDVFSTHVLDSFIELKRGEIFDVAMRPHPMEFELYYSV